MARIASLLFLTNIITAIDSSTTIGKIRSAAYVPNNFTNVELYNGTCAKCICYAWISNQSSTYEALNCYTQNNTCYLFRNFLPSSHIRSDSNSTVVFRSIPTNTDSCINAYSRCASSPWNTTANCCSNLSCVPVNQSYSWCLPATSLTTQSLTTGLADDVTRQDGRTGVNWGCCKPSCAWPDKAAVSTPPKTCAQDGVTAVDSNTPSVCNYGQSHMCTDQQPWNVSENLSYGFVGVNIINQNESHWCCACYSLVFVSGAVAGKQMIVQTVNTAYISMNMFTIHIPGGGWIGTINGCINQFGSGFTWGEQTDGVRNRSECANLPGVFQRGCYWRFDWLMNAYISDVRFKEITCPSILTNITGCIRH